jgi:DeoR/GlpR family transcriptional regulator of sugar metabolism
MKGVRQAALQDLLRQHGHMTVKLLSEHLEVSEATIRRDLRELSGSAGLDRIHGGVTFSEDDEPPVIARRRENAMAKLALGRVAAAEVYPGATIFIGSGSTMACLAECLLSSHELTVITNALNIASELAAAPGVTVMMTGGAFRKGEMSLIGSLAESNLRQTPFEIAFISAQGISAESGITNTFAPEASTDRVVVGLAPRLVVVVESHKLGRVAPISVGPATAASLVITDAAPENQEVARLRKLGIAVAHPHDSDSEV